MFQYCTSVSAHAKLLERIDLYSVQDSDKQLLLNFIDNCGPSSLTNLYILRGAVLHCHGNDGECVRYATASALNTINTNSSDVLNMREKGRTQMCPCGQHVTGLKTFCTLSSWRLRNTIRNWYKFMHHRYGSISKSAFACAERQT